MALKSYFDGRATIKSLLVTDQAANRTEICARINSPRGELAVLTHGNVPIRHLSYLEMRRGMIAEIIFTSCARSTSTSLAATLN